jgi:hypothetical protein
MVGRAPRWITAAGTLVHPFDLVCSTSKASLVLKLSVRWWRLPFKLVGYFNFRKNRRMLKLTNLLGFLPLDCRGRRLLLFLSRIWFKSPTNKIEMDWGKSFVMNSGHVGDNQLG